MRDEDSSAEIDFGQPWLLGFEQSRPEAGFSCGLTDICWERDIYRHPDRQGRPDKSFHKLHDIYALGMLHRVRKLLDLGNRLTLFTGVLLLEIGLWESAENIARSGRIGVDGSKQPSEKVYKIRETQVYFQKHARRRLESCVGHNCRQATLACLSGNFGVKDDTREELELQQAFERKSSMYWRKS